MSGRRRPSFITCYLSVCTPPRPLLEVDVELREREAQIQKLLGEVPG